MEAEKSRKKFFTKKKVIILVVILLILAIVAGIASFLFIRNRGFQGNMQAPPQMAGMGEDVISASGLTSAGMLEETWELDFLETSLYVEESYLSTGDQVESGTKVFKVSEDSLADARKELEDKVTETLLAYRQGVIDYETDLIDAEVTGEIAVVNQTYAQAEYDDAASKAAETVESLEQQVEEARELVDEYTKSATEDYYRTYYKVDELYQTYYEHFTLLMDYYEKWNIEELEDLYGNVSAASIGSSQNTYGSQNAAGQTSNSEDQTQEQSGQIPDMEDFSGMEDMSAMVKGVSKSSTNSDIMVLSLTSGSGEGFDWGSEDFSGGEVSSGAGNGNFAGGEMPEGGFPEGENAQSQGSGSFSGGGFGSGYDENQSKLSVYYALDEMVQEEGEEYKTALENYEAAKKKAAASLDQATSNLASLEAELIQAKADYEKELINCQADYQTTIAESKNAGTVYETTVQSLEETLASLQDDKEEAEENLALFEETIGDGYFYTKKAGTIVVNTMREGSYLSGETIIIAYSNPEEVTITASVDQSNIAKISVGDSVYVVVSEYGNYTGTVTSINPVTQAQSRSSVTYQVTVVLEGDVSNLESNLTAYLYFGMTQEMLQQMEGQTTENNRQENPAQNTETPVEEDMENMPQMPEGMDMENMPEMPEGMDMENMPQMPEGSGFDRENMPKGGPRSE